MTNAHSKSPEAMRAGSRRNNEVIRKLAEASRFGSEKGTFPEKSRAPVRSSKKGALNARRGVPGAWGRMAKRRAAEQAVRDLQEAKRQAAKAARDLKEAERRAAEQAAAAREAWAVAAAEAAAAEAAAAWAVPAAEAAAS